VALKQRFDRLALSRGLPARCQLQCWVRLRLPLWLQVLRLFGEALTEPIQI
jgi:hypothetical protein